MITFLKSLGDEIRFSFKKLGLLILFFIGFPFLSMWFTGAYYCNYVDDVGIAVLDEDNSQLSRQIVQYFDKNERFHVAYYAEDRTQLRQLIDTRKVYMGLYIPKGLSDHVTQGTQTQVLILTDGSNVIIGNNVYAGAASIVQSVSAGVAVQVLEGRGSLIEDTANQMVLTFGFEERMLYDPKMTYMNYLMYGIMTVFLQQLMLSSMATLMSRNAKETAKEHTFAKLMAKAFLAGSLLILSGVFSIFLIHNKFQLIYNSNVTGALLLTILFTVAICVPGIILFSLTKKKTRFTQIAYMLSLPTFLTCGYVWPVDQMPKLMVDLIRIIWPLMNYSRDFAEVMVKGLPCSAIRENIAGLALYILIGMPIAIFCFKKSFSGEERIGSTSAIKVSSQGEMNL